MNANVTDARQHGSSGKVSSLFGDAFSNWRLVLLAVTGLVLSLASGWTTWDGMSNFTCPNIDAKNAEPCVAPRILSGMITFGIQGVMLIIAWIIGETFAKTRSEQRLRRTGWFGGGLLLAGMLLVLAALAGVLSDQADNLTGLAQDLGSFTFPAIPATLGWWLVAGAAITLILARKELASRYISGFKTILAHIPLWIMFLSCMATSVFFSFDSLFSTIFPQGERVRAAKLRVENQVAGVLSDVQAQLAVRRLQATRQMFASSQWQTFDDNLDALVAQAEAAPDAVLQQKLARLNQSSSARTELRGVISTAKSKRGTFEAERARVDVEIKDLSQRRAPAAAQVAELEKQLDAKNAEIVTANTAAEGERQGVRGTGNAGAGPEFRRLRRIVQNLQLDASEIQTRLKAAQARVTQLNSEEANRRTRLAEIGKSIISLEEEIKEANGRMAVLDQSGQNTIAADLDAAGGIKALDVARNRFRRAPVESGLDQLEQLCTSLLANLRGVESLKTRTASVDCEPGDASVLANRIFSLQSAEEKFRANCTTGDEMPRGSSNKMLRFASVCIQDSGLPGADTEQFRTELNRIALNRDDKAHRFVVSWNAFGDGNALAYLALAIAIAIDGLVFMSGLFGANVIRSPLSAISEEELERIIDNALGDNKHKTLVRTINAIQENPDAGRSSFCHQIPCEITNEDSRVARVVAAGRDLDVVRFDDWGEAGRHLLHADFNKALQEATNRHQESFITDNHDDPGLKAEQIMGALKPKLIDALRPDVFRNANAVLGEIHPSSERVGYMGYVERPEQSFWSATKKALGRNGSRNGAEDARDTNDWYLQRAISVGTREGMVKTDDEGQIFYIRPLFFDALNAIRAEWSQKEASLAAPVTPVALPKNVQPMIEHANQPTDQSAAATPDVHGAATVPINILNREAEIRNEVRELMAKKLGLDDAAYKLVMADASTSGEVLASLRSQGRRLTDAVARHVEETAEEAIIPSLEQITALDDGNQTAEREARAFALAYAGRKLAPRWKATAKNLLVRFSENTTMASQDGTWLQTTSGNDPRLMELETQLHDLEIHDAFDQKLVALIVAAHEAETRLDELAERDEDTTAMATTRTAVNE